MSAAAEEGLAALDRYDKSGDPAELVAGAAALEQAVAETHRLDLVYLLGSAYDELGRFDDAIRWRARLADDLEGDDPERDEVVVHLADLLWDRSWRRRYGPDRVDDLDELIGDLATVSQDGTRPTVRLYLRLLYGLALCERDEPGIGVDMAEAAWTALAAAGDAGEWISPGRLGFTARLVAEACRAAARLDEADAVLHTALGWLGLDPEHAAELRLCLFWVADERWSASDEDDDLDAAITAGDRAAPLDGWDLAYLGEMLRRRADRRRSLPDARRAAESLRTAAADSGGEPGGWLMWQSAAAADRLAWELGGEQDRLAAAAEALDRALAGPLADGDRLDVLQDRLSVEVCFLNDDVIRPGDGTPLIRRLVEDAHRVLDRAIRADPDQRAVFAGLLAFAEFAALGADLGRFDGARLRGLTALAATARVDVPEWPAIVDWALGLVEHYEDALNPVLTSDGGMRRLSQIGAARITDPEFRQRVTTVLALAGYGRSSITGDARGGHAADHNGRLDPAGPGLGTAVLGVYSQLTQALRTRDVAAALALARQGQELFRGRDPSPADQHLRVLFDSLVALGDPLSATVPAAPAIEPGGMGEISQAGAAVMAASAAAAQAIARNDVPGMHAAVARVEAILPQISPGNVQIRRIVSASAAMLAGEVARRLPGDLVTAVHAVTLYERAVELSGGLQFALWADLNAGLAEMLRLSGETDLARTRRIGAAALQGHAWQVFGQSGTEHALDAARAAAEHAERIAAWCLADRETDPAADDDLIAVLDAGRGLVLRATTTSRQVPDQLARAGRSDLAAEWRATAGQGRDLVSGVVLTTLPQAPAEAAPQVPDELRFQVLRALGGDEVLGYEPIGLAEIQSVLGRLGADALVYLLPGRHGRPGRAVIVPGSGRPDVLTLPRLQAGERSPVRRFRPGGDVRDLGPAGPAAGAGVDDICEWAWDAAVGDLLAYASKWRRPRLVLVPMGILGVVPWHGAFTEAGGERRYAVREAVFSYSPSARMLVGAAGGDSPAPSAALVVGDPTGDLRYAGVEARAVHQAFYRDGSYFGRPVAGAARPGSPQDVLDWLGSTPDGSALLHLACHGAIDPARPADAHLVLAGPERLTVRTLLDRAAATALDLSQVFLAACTTGVSGGDHDEALSLATAFLAAGARTVFGSLWPVPDDGTALLMFMVHHFLRAGGAAPVDALHRAQLWMLDPGRVPPEGMPEPLRAQCRPGAVFDLASWSGFVHLGR
ncbi:CHAT domain-containing protein [Paractinoplanes lichenicola]|uniref:CHAT domain-containing protein n=1 Tax=Paractinoplanes lichenicola TaxID=2802976 RepID=A0ABS1VUA1_9ACTN|nr:CHAT domain-containing protein [Actinoplanes lichenicola]MBL7258030.1 CHAT domain-containing protein [Actinoplanes lichenicola]